jgi:hypothetical protein
MSGSHTTNTPPYHKRRTWATTCAAAALGVALLPGCTSGRAVASTVAPLTPPIALKALRPFYVSGETITWSVSLAGVEGGRARFAVGEVGDVDGRRVLVVRAEAESAGLLALVRRARDAMTSWIDVASGVPTRTESETHGLERNVRVHAARAAVDPVVEFTVWRRDADADPDAPGTQRTVRLPMLETHDPLSAVLVLRAWEAPRGARAIMYSLGGVRLWRTELLVEKREALKTELGRRETIRIAGVSRRLKPTLEEDPARPPRTFTVWVTDDEERIPVQITAHTEYGDVVARATSYDVALD